MPTYEMAVHLIMVDGAMAEDWPVDRPAAPGGPGAMAHEAEIR
jgi:hypothetical protein